MRSQRIGALESQFCPRNTQRGVDLWIEFVTARHAGGGLDCSAGLEEGEGACSGGYIGNHVGEYDVEVCTAGFVEVKADIEFTSLSGEQRHTR